MVDLLYSTAKPHLVACTCSLPKLKWLACMNFAESTQKIAHFAHFAHVL
jgi:hypothetical protein